MRQLIFMAKHWSPGLAKTRLAAAQGPHWAADFQKACIACVTARLAELHPQVGLVLAYAAPGMDGLLAEAAFAAVAGKAWQLWPQPGGDLGQRLALLGQDAFGRGAGQVVFIGSDSPTLPAEFIHRCWAELQTHDVVLGPAEDGGYYIIALKSPQPTLFTGIDWGTNQVLSQTLQRCQLAGLRVFQLPSWYDVDHAADLERLRRELLSPACASPAYDDLRKCVMLSRGDPPT